MAFSYKSFAQSFFVLEVKVKLFINARKLAQLRSKNIGEIDSSIDGQKDMKSKSDKNPFFLFLRPPQMQDCFLIALKVTQTNKQTNKEMKTFLPNQQRQ